MKTKQAAQLTRAREQGAKMTRWNQTTPPGTTVRYFPIRDGADAQTVVPDSEAWLLSGHTAVVRFKGKSGCFALDNCEAIQS
jgi:streptogramin lyase